MEHLDAILRISGNELNEVEKNGRYRSREEIDGVYKLVDIIKDIYCIMEMEDGMSYDYSDRYDGDSYARGRYAKRDSMGRYSKRSYRGYSRDGNEEYIENLRDMMHDAPDEQTRTSLKHMIDQMTQR